MKIFTTAIFLLFVLSNANSQSINLEWVTQINSNSSAITGSDLRTNENILIKGFYKDYIAMENDTVVDASEPNGDGYLLEISNQGSLNWVERFEFQNGEVYNRISSNNNNIYNLGRLISSPNNPNMVTIQELAAGQSDSLFSMPGDDIDIDMDGNIYVTGYFQETVDFDAGPGEELLTSIYSLDTYLAKYDSNRNVIWAKSIPGLGVESGRVVSIDYENNVYITASFRDSIDLDPDMPGYELPNDASQTDSYYLSKYSPEGQLLWYKPLNGIGRNTINSVAFDKDNNVIIVGGFRQSLSYEIDGNSNTILSKGDEDIFVAKLDAQGNLLWVNHIGGPNDQYGLSVKVNDQGDIFVLGSFYENVQFDPSDNTPTVSNGFSDSFIQIYNSDGDYVNHFTYGGTGFDWARFIHIDRNNDLILVSSAGGVVDVDLGDGEFFITPADFRSSFVAKYSLCLPSSSEQSYTICDGDVITINGTDFDVAGVYNQTLTNSGGCDSTVTINLNVNDTYLETVNASICEGDTLNSYFEEGTYEILDMAQNGCDSITFLQISFLPDTDPDCIPTNVDDLENKVQINIHPNPIADVCHFKSNEPVEKVIIFDANGHKVFESSDINNNQINTAFLNRGIYIFHVQNKEKTSFFKMVKL